MISHKRKEVNTNHVWNKAAYIVPERSMIALCCYVLSSARGCFIQWEWLECWMIGRIKRSKYMRTTESITIMINEMGICVYDLLNEWVKSTLIQWVYVY
jgi:hypothetical protein